MANDFSGDPSVKALWRFESGALAVDSKGGNTLTNNNSATVDTSVFMEGAGSLLCDHPAQRFLSIADGDLDAGFPLKIGDAVQTISVNFWYKPGTIYADAIVFSKGWNSGSNNSFAFAEETSGYLGIYWYGTGGYEWGLGNIPTFIANHVYHVSINIDGINKIIKVRIFDQTASTINTYNISTSYPLVLSDGILAIGGDGGTNGTVSGNFDEVVVFNRLLSDAEIDAIRGGTYTPPQVNDFSGDASCKALWRFESGALVVDSIGANTLTNHGGTEETSAPLEGACSIQLASASSQYLSIADADLSAGFPLKTGDTTKAISLCMRYKPNSLASSDHVLWGKWGSNFCFLADVTYGSLSIGWATSNSIADWSWGSIYAFTVGHDYHIAFLIDGIAKTIQIIILDTTTGVLTSIAHTYSSELNICNADLTFGAVAGGGAYIDGIVDEVVVFNRLLNYIEVFNILEGVYVVPISIPTYANNNNFLGDSSCKALWRFESGALAVDPIGANTLTLVNSPSANTSTYKEGAASISFNGSDQLAYINDADLCSGFPLKGNDSVMQATIAGWFYLNSAAAWQALLAKRPSGQGIWFGIGVSGLYLSWPYSSGGGYEEWNLGVGVTAGRWYHITILIDGIAKTANILIYDQTTNQLICVFQNFTNTFYVGDAGPFSIGSVVGPTIPANVFADEVVVFNRLLNYAEIFNIVNGIYGAGSWGTRDLTTSCAVVSTASAPLVTVTRPLTTSVAIVSAVSEFALWKNSITPYPYSTPNTPANDPTCVSRWRFETGDNIQDSIGGNDLTGMPLDNPPGTTPTCKEGISAQAFELANSQYLTRADADLSAGFPLKSSAGQIGNISCWIYANTTGTTTQTLLAKGDDSSGILVQHWYGYICIFWMGEEWWGFFHFTPGQWYQLSINFDGPNKTCGVRIWDDTAQLAALNQHSFTNALTGNSSPFTVGGPGSFWDGAIDELIVWNRKLTIAEMELVQEQYFHGDVNVENNNFTSDPFCQAIWDFEESAPAADSSGKGNNIVTDNLFASNGLVGAGTGGKFGSGYGGITGAYIPDANLANGFPFKSNDTIKRVTVCAWVVPLSSFGFGGTIYSKKGESDNNGFEIKQDSSSPYHLKIVWGDGTNLTTYDTGIALNGLYSYHISVEIDGVNKTIYVEVFNNYTGVLYDYSVSPSTQATVGSSGVGIGNSADAPDKSFNGFIDQVVVWNRLLATNELASVRVGTFVCHLLATNIAIQSHVSDINLNFVVALTSSISVISTVGTPVLAVKRPLSVSMNGVSTVSAPNLLIQRALATLAAVVSATSDINLGRFGLTFTNVAVLSQVRNVDLAVSRLLNNSIAVQSQIPGITLKVLRDLVTAILGRSAVSSPAVDIANYLVTAIQVTTETSAAALTVLRDLATAIAAQAVMPDISLAQHAFWDLITTIAIKSQVSGDLTLAFFESLLAKAKRFYGPVNADTLRLDASQWIVEEEQRELHLPGDQFNDHEF